MGVVKLYLTPERHHLKRNRLVWERRPKKKAIKKRNEKETNIADHTRETEASSYYFFEYTLKDALTAKNIMNTLSGTRLSLIYARVQLATIGRKKKTFFPTENTKEIVQ